MKTITPETVLQFDPCVDYPEERIRELFAGRESATPLEIIDEFDAPPEDKLWLLLREDFLPDRELHIFACWCAEQTLPIFEARQPGDGRPRAAVETKRRWIDGGATDGELDAARAAAGDAAWAAAWSAARNAARSAAWAARAARAEGAAAGDAQLAHLRDVFARIDKEAAK
jgi:hypothetical protein